MAPTKIQTGNRREIMALKVHQWLDEWDGVRYDRKKNRRKPGRWFYLFTLPAFELRKLCGIERRTTAGRLPRSKDPGIQRRHDEARSRLIESYVQFGFPWSDLSESQRRKNEYEDLRMPGWLPTAIVVNILRPGEKRGGKELAPEDAIEVDDRSDDGLSARIYVPRRKGGIRGSSPDPLEIIDGQHRLYAFQDQPRKGDYDLPVVAFHGLDLSFRAYLFYTINIKPKRINTSLAFDMYPLLRTEDWLEHFEGPSIYREARAQELVEILWSYGESPWYGWINMLGEPGLSKGWVRQAAWIRSLLATFIKKWDSSQSRIGGLFGAPAGHDKQVIPWSRPEQAAFLILIGQRLRDAISNCKEDWAESLRKEVEQLPLEFASYDKAFYSSHSLLNTDQGIRGILYVTNDLCYVRADKLNLFSWDSKIDSVDSDAEKVRRALKSFGRAKVAAFIDKIASALAKYDWRTSSALGLREEQRRYKAGFRGSGGYRMLREELLKHLACERNDAGEAAREVIRILRYK